MDHPDKQGLTFHNGKEATSDDLLYSMQVAANPNTSYGAPAVAQVDAKSMRKVTSTRSACLVRSRFLPSSTT